MFGSSGDFVYLCKRNLYKRDSYGKQYNRKRKFSFYSSPSKATQKRMGRKSRSKAGGYAAWIRQKGRIDKNILSMNPLCVSKSQLEVILKYYEEEVAMFTNKP